MRLLLIVPLLLVAASCSSSVVKFLTKPAPPDVDLRGVAGVYRQPVDPTARYYFLGGWVLPPQGSGWLVERVGHSILFSRDLDKGRWAYAGVSSADSDTVSSWEGFADRARRIARGWQGDSTTVRSFAATPDSTVVPAALRYRYQSETPAGPYSTAKVFIREGHGVMRVHPQAPGVTLDLEFSQSAKDVAPIFDNAAADSFLTRFEFNRIDTTAVRRVEVGCRPYLLKTGAGALWVAAPAAHTEGDTSSTSEVLRLDLSTREIQARARIKGGIADLVVTPNAVWVCDILEGVLSCLDPTSLAVTGTVKLGGHPERLLATSETLWVTDRRQNTVEWVDLGSMVRDPKPMRDLKQPFGILEAAGLVWIEEAKSHKLSSFEPGTRKRLGKSISIAEEPGEMAYGAGSIWIFGGKPEVQRIDPASRAVIATIPLRFLSPPTGDRSRNIVFAGGALWVGNSNEGMVVKIDPSTNLPSADSYYASLSVDGVTASEAGVWVGDAVSHAISMIPID